jgi:hypothetical protein
MPWGVRAVLWITAAQALLLVLALVDPRYVNLLVPWPASPLNARFIASLYVALAIGVVACSVARNYIEARIVLVGIAMVTTVLFFLTLLRMYLHPHELPHAPIFWLLFYAIDPLMVAGVFWRFGWGPRETPVRGALTVVWVAEALLFGIPSLIFLVSPESARSVWPWAITEPQAQLYSVFFLTIATASVLAAREARWESVRWLALMITLLALLILSVSLFHLPRFTRPAATGIWFAIFTVEALVFGGVFLMNLRHSSTRVAARA